MDSIDWRNLPDPEDFVCEQGEIPLVGLYLYVLHMFEQETDRVTGMILQQIHIPRLEGVNSMEGTLEQWLAVAEGFLPEWAEPLTHFSFREEYRDE